MAKSNRSGQTRVLTPEKLRDLWAELAQPYRPMTQIAYGVVSLERPDLRGNGSSAAKTKTTRTAQVPAQLSPDKALLAPSTALYDSTDDEIVALQLCNN